MQIPPHPPRKEFMAKRKKTKRETAFEKLSKSEQLKTFDKAVKKLKSKLPKLKEVLVDKKFPERTTDEIYGRSQRSIDASLFYLRAKIKRGKITKRSSQFKKIKEIVELAKKPVEKIVSSKINERLEDFEMMLENFGSEKDIELLQSLKTKLSSEDWNEFFKSEYFNPVKSESSPERRIEFALPQFQQQNKGLSWWGLDLKSFAKKKGIK